MYCFAKICRLCLSHDSALIHCRFRDKNNIPNYHKIKILFPQLVNKTSQHFPIWICTKCQEQVNQSYEFKQKCYKTYKLLKKYSVQLFEANKDNNIPDVPTEIFQEVKPIIDKNIISIEEDHSENYYNADDITIVKNELLPSNFKNEPEFNNMIQDIIDKNFETIRQIDGDISRNLKRELINNSEANSSSTINERLVHDDEVQQVQQVSSSIVSEIYNEPSASEEEHGSNNTINSLDAAAFTLDYTNASFETFVSHVAPSITVASDFAAKDNVTNVEENLLNSSTRVLRRRKSICYRTMERRSDEFDDIPNGNVMSLTKVTNNIKYAKKQIAAKRQKKVNGLVSSQKLLERNNTKKQNGSVTRASKLIEKVIKIQKQKYGTYFCEKCSKKYVLFTKFSLHTSKCNGIIRHQCTVCHKFFANSANLRRHGNIHLKPKSKAICDFCPNKYSTKTALLNHIRTQHYLNMNKTNPFF